MNQAEFYYKTQRFLIYRVFAIKTHKTSAQCCFPDFSGISINCLICILFINWKSIYSFNYNTLQHSIYFSIQLVFN